MSDLDLDRIEAYCNAATPEPWCVGGPYPAVAVSKMVDPGCDGEYPEPPIYERIAELEPYYGQRCPDPHNVANAEFIWNARTDLPRLAEEVRLLRARVAELETTLRGRTNYCAGCAEKEG